MILKVSERLLLATGYFLKLFNEYRRVVTFQLRFSSYCDTLDYSSSVGRGEPTTKEDYPGLSSYSLPLNQDRHILHHHHHHHHISTSGANQN